MGGPPKDMVKNRSRIKSAFVVILIFLVLALLITELYLRYVLSPRHQSFFYEDHSRTAICQPDPYLGWVNKPGVYSSPSPFPHDPPLTITIRDDGSRATASLDIGNPRHRLVLVGGSGIFGQGLSDEQTMAWKLGRLLPQTQVLNYGVMAYGTYQSMLMLEKVLSTLQGVDIVIYGFIPHHIDRNVAPAYWRNIVNMLSSKGVKVPYVTLSSENRLVRHSPQPFAAWFASRYLVTFRILEIFLERTYFFLSENDTEKHTIMQLLLLRMRNLCNANGCRLVVAMLDNSRKIDSFYTRFCRANQIPVINFDISELKGVPLTNPRDGHPTEAVNTIWAEQAAPFLLKMINGRGNDSQGTDTS